MPRSSSSDAPMLSDRLPWPGRMPRLLPGVLACLLLSAMDTAGTDIALQPLSSADARRLEEPENSPFLIAFGRALPASRRAHAAGTVTVSSPGALALRLALRVEALPDDARLRFSAAAGRQAHDVTGAEVNTGAVGGLYWSPTDSGEAISVHIELPGDAGAAQAHVELLRVAHYFRLPFLENSEAADPCRVEPACHPAWDRASRVTAMVVHTREDGATSVCAGTLVNFDGAAYFATAEHCVPDQARASGVETYWFLRSRCDGPRDAHQVITGGAELLHVDRTTDTALLRLRGPAPAGAEVVGWSAALPAVGTAVVGIHQPAGGLQAIAFGRIVEHVTCDRLDNCGDDADFDQAHYLRVQWVSGCTAPGSSGSGLFLEDGRLVGTLLGGTSGPGNPSGKDSYGKFRIGHSPLRVR
jgi:lysyl endopeptidase